MSKVIKIRKGLDIRLEGKAEKIYKKAELPVTFAVKPTDFAGLTPKLCVKEGDVVKAGSVLFFDKYRPEVVFTSPVSGVVSEVRRGERRKLLAIVVKPDQVSVSEEFKKGDPLQMTRDEIIDNILKSGLWPSVRQRPYAVIANPADTPKSIFVPCFDSAPLAPDFDFLVKGEGSAFQTGIDALSKLTEGKIHLTLNAEFNPSEVFANVKNVEKTSFSGPHPAGSVGVQIHHIDPINKGDLVWYIYPQEVIAIGRLFQKGALDMSRIVALTGSEVKKPIYYKTVSGCNITAIHENAVNEGTHRFISGNVLTGTSVGAEGHLGFYDYQITVIPEGNHHAFLGWAAPGFDKFSNSRTFWSWLNSSKKYRLDTNMNGGHRAFVMTGEYEKVLPMDIYPMHLLKAILAEDLDKMEQLGLYEVAEEDMALCEFVCTSKTEVQQILRKGIELMIKELG